MRLYYQSRTDFLAGCRDCLPLMVGGVPFGIMCGVMAASAGFTPMEVLLMSLLVFSGTSQYVAIMMFQSGNALLGSLFLNVLLVNLHNLLLMASLSPYIANLPGLVRNLLCFGISDGTYAITMNRIRQFGYSADYQLGASAVQYIFWTAANMAGVFLINHVPNLLSWGLDFTITAVFIAILIPQLCDRITLCVSLAATVAAVLGACYLSGKWYILLACGTAVITGVLLEGRIKNET